MQQYRNTSNKLDDLATITSSPKPIADSKITKPIVAPDTKGKDFLNPYLMPLDKPMKFTGPRLIVLML